MTKVNELMQILANDFAATTYGASQNFREALEAALAEPEQEPSYRSMYLKVRDELAELQQQHEKCVALARSVMCDNTGSA